MKAARPVLLTLGITLLVLATTGRVGAGEAADGRRAELVEEGEQLYLTACSSCHGAEGGGVVTEEGNRRGPSLRESGEASAFYYLSTGRMPLSDPENQARRKDPAYTPEEIDALVAYVGSLGDGPAVPQVDTEGTDLAAGGLLYRGNCQACHSAFGSGGALSYGYSAPSLYSATPTEVGAAVRIGPGLMPVFSETVIDDEELDDLAAYVEYLRSPANPGGAQIGRNGPVPEGFVAWMVGIGGLLLMVAWVGGLVRPGADEDEEEGTVV